MRFAAYPTYRRVPSTCLSLQIQPITSTNHKHKSTMSKPVVLAAAAAAAAYYLYKNKKEDEPEEVVRVSHAEALEKTTAALKAVGWDDEGARVQASIMVSSEACGNNQGLVKMFKPEPGARAGAGKPAVERDGASASSRAINPRHARPDQSRGPRLRQGQGRRRFRRGCDTSTSSASSPLWSWPREGAHRHHHGELAGVRRGQGRRPARPSGPILYASPAPSRGAAPSSSTCRRRPSRCSAS